MKRDCFKTEMKMKLSSILFILHSLCITLKAAQGVSMAKRGCDDKCGKITVPYPFGIGPDHCSAGPNFKARCDTNTFPPKLFLSALNLEARRFFVTQQTVQVVHPVSHMTCSPEEQSMELAKLSIKRPYNLSSIYSRFVVIGCDNIVSMLPSYGACNPYCSPKSQARGCNGVHCCQANIPPGLKELSIIYRTVTETTSGTCGYAFLTDDKWLKEQVNTDFKQMRKPLKEVTLVLQWEFDITKMEQQKTVVCSNASRSDNSTVCSCKEGFEGNPFLVEEDGCRDINECDNPKLNTCKVRSNCVNKEGTFICQESIMPKLAYAGAGSGLGALVLLAGAWMSAKVVKKRMDVNQKAYFFKRNGGGLLQEQLPYNDSGGGEFRIFSSEELEQATNHYKSLELGRGGQGIVYKGMLSDGKIVAVKKEVHEEGEGREVDEASIKPFITEVLILSQINHKNIVKLLGCCLETEVPILVYEFVPNGTLFNYIHGRKHEFPWERRLTIATQVAEAISELHNAKPYPIYHRDVKSTNVLLDEEYQAKVSDFGMPWSVSVDKDNLPTRLRMTDGYADPSYLQSRKYTEKSDVYSFGVVMVELLTGDRAVSEENKKVLATHFLESMKENKLLDIVDGEVKNGPEEEIVAFADLARRCLDFDVKVRPTMKVATEELVGIKKPKEGSRTQPKREDTEIESAEVSDVSDYPSTSTTPNLNVFTGEP